MRIFFQFSVAFVFISLIFVCSTIGQTSQTTGQTSQTTTEKIYRANDVDEKAEITKRPRARIMGECGTEKNSSGRVRVEVVLNKTGKVSDAKLLEVSDCRYFNNRVLEVAKKIKFKPAIKDGNPVSQYSSLAYEYNFFVVK